jgi:glycosyltransferase involved in cell wall biosynthesis
MKGSSMNKVKSDLNTFPLVSFIMPVYNRAAVLERALEGILREKTLNYPNIEILVIDGGSTDGTLEILKRYEDRIDFWKSERDKGAADAFNKGMQISKGQIIRYVASDDEIEIGHTEAMVRHLVENPDLGMVGALSNVVVVDEKGTAKKLESPNPPANRLVEFRDVFHWSKGANFSYIETWFIRRDVFKKIGLLDTRYRICPDLDFAMRAVKSGVLYQVVPIVIINKFFYSDNSNLISDYPRRMAEMSEVLWRHSWLRPEAWLLLYNFPAPLHSRLVGKGIEIFFSLWISLIKSFKRLIWIIYAAIQKIKLSIKK